MEATKPAPANAHRLYVLVDKSRCCGAGLCALTAPEVFDQAADGLVIVLQSMPTAEQQARVLEAERMCPTGTITVEKR
jgi:ferredoxin